MAATIPIQISTMATSKNSVPANSTVTTDSTAATAANPTVESSTDTNIQKKFLNYARNYALEKISKKLDKAQAKQHDRYVERVNGNSGSGDNKQNDDIDQQPKSKQQQQQQRRRRQNQHNPIKTYSIYKNVKYANDIDDDDDNDDDDDDDDDGVQSAFEYRPHRPRRQYSKLNRIKQIQNHSTTSIYQSNQSNRRPTGLQYCDNDDDFVTADDADDDQAESDTLLKHRWNYLHGYNRRRYSQKNCTILEIPSDTTEDYPSASPKELKSFKCNLYPTTVAGTIGGVPSPASPPGSPAISSTAATTTPGTHAVVTSPNDYSGYIQKKSFAQGMMDLALVSANTNQLRYILEYQNHHPYFGLSLALVISSLFLQVVVGMTLIWNTRFNVKKRNEMKEADRVNNISVIGIFMVTLINVFLSTFGGAPQNPDNVAVAVATDVTDSMTTITPTMVVDASKVVYT